MVKLAKALMDGDFINALISLQALSKDLKNSCPLAELDQMDKEIEDAIHSGTIIKNITANLIELLSLIAEAKKHAPEPEAVGALMGNLYKIVIIGKVHNLRFLSAVPALTGPSMEAFINGFITGTSDVAADKSQCVAVTKTYIPELSASIEALITAFRTATGIKDAFVRFMQTAVKLKDTEGTCHFISLATTLITITNPITLAKIGYRITTNLGTLITHIKESAKTSKAGDFNGFGGHIGGIFKILFEYHTQ